MNEVEIIERLGRIEEKLNSQDVIMNDIKKDIEIISQSLESRVQANGKQDVSIARLDERLAHIEDQLKRRDWRIWSAFVAAMGALLQGIAEWFLGK